MESTPDILIFLGRFHALAVHLPIGFVCIALLIEVFFRKSNATTHRTIVNFIWLVAAFSATAAVVLGYFLSMQGGYDDGTLNWHKWSGILLALVIHICYFLRRARLQKKWISYSLPISLSICTLLLIVTGHYGGSLTHGSGYLNEYQPHTLAGWFGVDSDKAVSAKKIETLDSADIFSDAVLPIIRAKCVSCHNAEKKKGNLVMLTYEEMLKGGEEGPALVPGNLEKSTIYQRITLPEDDKKFMPADGKKPLTSEQFAILRWWIENQAPQSAMISTMQPDSATRKILTDYLGIAESNNSLAFEASPLDPAVINDLKKAGFLVTTLSEKSNLLQATINNSGKDKMDTKLLTAAKDQLVWLKISHAGKLDTALSSIGELINLRKLTVNDSEIASDGIDGLLSLSNLEYLNLYGTSLSTKAVESLLTLKNLKQLYIGGVDIDSLAMSKLVIQYPKIKIIYQQPDNELSKEVSGGK